MSSLRINDPEYQAQRAKAIRRDAGRCVDCGWSLADKGAKQLHVHHVTPEDEFPDGAGPHFTENLATLCSMCHGSWEREFRRLRDGSTAWDQEVHDTVVAWLTRAAESSDAEFIREYLPGDEE